MIEQPNYYAIIPANVRYNGNLTSSDKLFYSEITCLTHKTGQCWASNKYFSNLYKVDNSTISKWIKKLQNEDLIDVEYIKEGKEIKQRIITLKGMAYVQEGMAYVQGEYGIYSRGYGVESKENNTSINNTSINNKRNIKESFENINNHQNEQVENSTSSFQDTNALREYIKCLKKEIEMLKKKSSKHDVSSYNISLFDKFWNAYPKKVSKGNAEKWFVKNRPSEELVNEMIEKLNILKKTDQWTKDNGQYIPYPSTWLNAKGWEDEVEEEQKEEIKESPFDWVMTKNGVTCPRNQVPPNDEVAYVASYALKKR